MTVKLSQIKPNPNNPRLIKDDKFLKLVQSIKEFPEMLDIRPIVVNKDMIVLGGNMRLKACKEAGLKEVPIIVADNLTEEQQREFIIKDNVSGGEWDWSILANEWNVEDLDSWGLDLPLKKEDIEKINLKDIEFEKTIKGIKDEDAELPIVPFFMEKQECFIIPVSNEIDENFIRNVFNLNRNFKSIDNKIRKSNVITVENVREIIHSSTDKRQMG